MTKLTVTTAQVLSDKEKEVLTAYFKAKTEQDAEVSFLTNDTLIGGMVIFDGDKLFDGSVKHRLDVLKGNLSDV